VILDTISDGDSGNLVHNWFSDLAEGNPHMSGGDITRDKAKMAFQTGENDSTLTLYAVGTFPTTFRDSESSPSERPAICYRYSNPPGGKFSQPTFSPDGASLAWGAGDGIYVVSVPSFGGGCTLDGATPTPPLVIPGGSEPDWGPADVPARSVVVKRAKLSVSVLSVTRRAVALRVKAPGKGRLTATARGARATKAVKRAGSATLRLKTRAKKVKVTFKPASGRALTKTVRVR
jgi:hypothetical protein